MHANTEQLLLGTTVLLLLGVFAYIERPLWSSLLSRTTSNEYIHQTSAHTASNTSIFDLIDANYTCYVGENKIRGTIRPHFIIAGAQKAGTTALRRRFGFHPMFPKNPPREIHFFDRDNSILQMSNFTLDDDLKCRLRQKYSKNEKFVRKGQISGSLVFDKTPLYMALPFVPKLIRQVCSWNPKIIMILRNPINRLHSHHTMKNQVSHKQRGVPTKNLDETIRQEVEKLRKWGLSNAPPISDMHLPGSSFGIPDFSLAHVDNLLTQEYQRDSRAFCDAIIFRGMYAIQIEFWLSQGYEIGRSLLLVNYEKFLLDPRAGMNEMLEFLGIPSYDWPSEAFESRYYTIDDRFRQTMSNFTREYLQSLYRPHNKRLAKIAGDDWIDVWD
jgi:hypothetical protein